MTKRTIMLTVDVIDDASFVDVYERLGRVCAGEILNGREARISSFLPEEDDDQ